MPVGKSGCVEVWVPRAPESLVDDTAIQSGHDRSRFNETMPYWAWLWDTAHVMAKLLGSFDVTGRVLEVGAGLGLVGIAAAIHEKGRVELTLSDNDSTCLEALLVNAERNGLSGARVLKLDWTEPDKVDLEPFDVVLGCEVIYDPCTHGALLDVLERYLKPGEGRALFADPGRTRVGQFLKRARARGFGASIMDVTGEPADPKPGEFRLLQLTQQ